LKRALEDSVADPARDLTELAVLANSVEAATMILDLVGDYATGEWDAQKPGPFLQ
jgi:hypothetical protein